MLCLILKLCLCCLLKPLEVFLSPSPAVCLKFLYFLVRTELLYMFGCLLWKLSLGYNDGMAARFSTHTSLPLHDPLVNTSQQIQVPGTDNLLAFDPPRSLTPGSHGFGESNLNSYRGIEESFSEDEIHTRSREIFENKDTKHLLHIFNMGGQVSLPLLKCRQRWVSLLINVQAHPISKSQLRWWCISFIRQRYYQMARAQGSLEMGHLCQEKGCWEGSTARQLDGDLVPVDRKSVV